MRAHRRRRLVSAFAGNRHEVTSGMEVTNGSSHRVSPLGRPPAGGLRRESHALKSRSSGRALSTPRARARQPLSPQQRAAYDLSQVADLGLVKAIRGFDPARQNGFAAYAVPTILGELRRHFRDRVWNLRLPRGLQESSMTVERAIEHLIGQLGRSPTVRELADETGYSIEDVNETLIARDARRTESMERRLGATTVNHPRYLPTPSASPTPATTASRPTTPPRPSSSTNAS